MFTWLFEIEELINLNLNEFTINAKDNTRLFFKEFTPTVKAKAVIAIVHGLGDHSGWFSNLINYFISNEYAVITFDLRGHGKSEGKRGHIPSYEAVLSDIDILYGIVKEHFNNIPIFLYGHSFGGNLVLNYTLDRHPKVTGIITTGPWLKLVDEPSDLKLKFISLLDKIKPDFSLANGVVDASNLSHNLDLQKTYNSDPLVHNYVSARLFINAHNRGLWAINNASQFNVPLLLMHGGKDSITSSSASKAFADNTKEGICTYKEWEGLYHSLHNEINYKEIYAYTNNWIESVLHYENEAFGG